MNLVETIDSITKWFDHCAAAVEHNPQDWASPRELVDDFITLGIKHRGADIGSFSPEERLKFQIALAKHMTFFADCKLFRAKPKPRTESVGDRLQSLPEQGYQISAFGEKLASSSAQKQRCYIAAMYGLNRIKSALSR